MITKRQCIILIIICVIATKLQRMFSLVSLRVGRDGWLVLLAVGIFDVLFLTLSLWFFNRHNEKNSAFDVVRGALGRPMEKITYFIMFVYYFVAAILPFVATHDLYANILFDQLDYGLFGVFYCLVVVFLAIRGLKTFGRQGEIYIYVIAIGFLGIITLGLFTTELSRVLPFFECSTESFLRAAGDLSMWFGDYIILFFLVGKVELKKGEKIWWSLIIPFALIVIVIGPLACAIFYGIYNNLAGFQNNAASSLTQFSLLTLDIGRMDWFLVLFEQISTICSACVFVFMSASCFCSIFNIKKTGIPIIVITAALFLFDVLVFSDLSKSVPAFISLVYIFGIFMNYAFPFLMVFSSLIFARKQRRLSQ